MSSPEPFFVDALKAVNPDATLDNLRAGCRMIVSGSDLRQFAEPPLSEREIDIIADAIFEFIVSRGEPECDPKGKPYREIVLDTAHDTIPKEIEYTEFASRESEDWQFHWYPMDLESLAVVDLIPCLEMNLARLLYRYCYCVVADDVHCPISPVFEYLKHTQPLWPKDSKQADEFRNHILHATLLALCSLDRSPFNNDFPSFKGLMVSRSSS